MGTTPAGWYIGQKQYAAQHSSWGLQYDTTVGPRRHYIPNIVHFLKSDHGLFFTCSVFIIDNVLILFQARCCLTGCSTVRFEQHGSNCDPMSSICISWVCAHHRLLNVVGCHDSDFSHAEDMIAYGPWFEAASRFCVLRHFTRSMAPSVLNGVEVKEAAHVSDFRRIDVCVAFAQLVYVVQLFL